VRDWAARAVGDRPGLAGPGRCWPTDIVTQQRSEFDLVTGSERVFRPPFAEADAADRAG
jgi:hypothetical protein